MKIYFTLDNLLDFDNDNNLELTPEQQIEVVEVVNDLVADGDLMDEEDLTDSYTFGKILQSIAESIQGGSQ